MDNHTAVFEFILLPQYPTFCVNVPLLKSISACGIGSNSCLFFVKLFPFFIIAASAYLIALLMIHWLAPNLEPARINYEQ